MESIWNKGARDKMRNAAIGNNGDIMAGEVEIVKQITGVTQPAQRAEKGHLDQPPTRPGATWR